MTDLERQIDEALRMPCGCILGMLVRDCPDCLPKRIAAAIEAGERAGLRVHAWVDGSGRADHEAALRALKGEP